FRTEIVSLPLMLVHVPGAGAVHLHAAHRIFGDKIALRVSEEALAAALAAEEVLPPLMLGGRFAGGWIDNHAADRITHGHVGAPVRRSGLVRGVLHGMLLLKPARR